MNLILLLILFLTTPCFADSESTIGGKTAAAHIIQSGGTSLRPRPYLNFTGSISCSDSGGKTVCNGTGGGGGSVSSVTATGPLSSSGGTTPNISISTADTVTSGSISSTDWNTFNNKADYTTIPSAGIVSVNSSPYNVTTSDVLLEVDTTSSRTINLPNPNTRRRLYIIDVSGNASTNNITLHRNGSEKIMNLTSDKVLATNWSGWTIASDGTNWWMPTTGKKVRLVFTGSTTWTAPAGVTEITVWARPGSGGGGGGGGGGAGFTAATTGTGGGAGGSGGGGGSCGLVMAMFRVIPGNSYTITIGAHGTGGTFGAGGAASGSAGGPGIIGIAGGATVFGTTTFGRSNPLIGGSPGGPGLAGAAGVVSGSSAGGGGGAAGAGYYTTFVTTSIAGTGGGIGGTNTGGGGGSPSSPAGPVATVFGPVSPSAPTNKSAGTGDGINKGGGGAGVAGGWGGTGDLVTGFETVALGSYPGAGGNGGNASTAGTGGTGGDADNTNALAGVSGRGGSGGGSGGGGGTGSVAGGPGGKGSAGTDGSDGILILEYVE